ncbi:MAG: S9 family peptidase [Gemmatimonadaceae bacterium]|nr:S9 family peptidase [Gemmatimonadaceae bacterium]
MPALSRAIGRIAAASLLVAPLSFAQRPSDAVPSMKDWLSMQSVGAPVMAPDGSGVAYPVTTADWENNRYDTEIWLARPGTAPFQITATEKESSITPRWSPDSRWIAFLADRGDGRQLFLIRAAGGEARRLTNVKGGITDVAWAPDGSRIAFTSAGPDDDETVARRKAFGEYTVENEDYRLTRLFLVAADTGSQRSIAASCIRAPAARGADSAAAPCVPVAVPTALPIDANVGSFAWSPDSRRIAFTHTPNPLLSFGGLADISVVDVASRTVRPLVAGPGADSDPVWSPDGTRVLFSTAAGDTASNYYRNARLAVVSASGGATTVLTSTFDENPGSAVWLPSGIRFLAAQGTAQRLFTLDATTGSTRSVLSSPAVVRSTSFSRDGSAVAFIGEDATTLPEIYRTTLTAAAAPVKLTSMTAQTAGWALGTREVVSWASKDGARIEGVLYKPANYDPARRHPLLVAIHGGPTGISRPVLGYGSVYPITQFLAKGAVVLMPNYRGSAGYGEKFRSLNVRNLGVGDAWDVLSGVDSMIARGIADSTRMGSMGWSQGGYISAFLTTTSNRFKAVSVGAGISDWTTYYVSTDIHPFTRQYLQATPWSDPEIYAKTSPITYVKQARTPTLIQHGELDRRVPISNAYQLYQALQDVGVPTRLVVYKGFGHGITKPREQLAASWHNWEWFSKYIWNETAPALREAIATAGAP